MSGTQFLLLLIAIIPFINCLIITLCSEVPILVRLTNKTLPFLFLANLFGLYSSLKNDQSYLVIAEAMRGVSIGFAADEISLKFLFLLNFLWIIFAFYSQRFLQLGDVKNANNLQIFFVLIVALANLIIISKNLLSVLFFYNCQVFFCHFFALKFLHKTETRFSRFFTFLLYLESFLLFLAIVATYKFTGQIEFTNDGIVSQNFDRVRHTLLFALYFSGLFLSIIFPCYIFYRHINLDPLVLYIFFFLAYGFSGLYLLIKLISFIFGFRGFFVILNQIGFSFFEIIFLINIAISSMFLLLARGIKSSFFYLFFHQFTFALFAIFFFAAFGNYKIYLPVFSFLFSFTLVFTCISNVVLFLSKAENKSLNGVFYELGITSVLLIFAISNMAGLAPAIGAIEKFFLLKIILEKKLWLSAAILSVNSLSLILFAGKMLWPFFMRPKEPRRQEDKDLAKNIDFDSSLILAPLTLAVLMFLGLIIFPFFSL